MLNEVKNRSIISCDFSSNPQVSVVFSTATQSCALTIKVGKTAFAAFIEILLGGTRYQLID
jgi:hypothetical protein